MSDVATSGSSTGPLKAPFVWHGGKSKAAPVVWRAFGCPPNYVEPFGATLAVLLGRPGGAGKIECVNDINADIANFWRASIADPLAVAEAADWPVNEADLHARRLLLLETLPEHRERMHTQADYFDAKRAGIWVWGVCTSIRGNWLDERERNSKPNLSHHQGIHTLPALGHSGRGIHSPERESLQDWFRRLRDRLRRVKVACGDYKRVLSGAVTGASNTLKNMGMSPCAVFLDPPYPGDRAKDIYANDSLTIAHDVAAWAIEHGSDQHFRIAYCGYAGETPFPEDWVEYAWKANGGHGNRNSDNKNRHRERIWFSPHCLPIDEQRSLFEVSP